MTAPSEEVPESGTEVGVGASEVGPEVAQAMARRGRHQKPAPTQEELDRRDRTWDVRFKKIYGSALLVLVIGQVVAADIGFFAYAIASSWELDSSITVAWLSAAVVQVIGLAWLVVRSVFPPEPPRPRRAD